MYVYYDGPQDRILVIKYIMHNFGVRGRFMECGLVDQQAPERNKAEPPRAQSPVSPSVLASYPEVALYRAVYDYLSMVV